MEWLIAAALERAAALFASLPAPRWEAKAQAELRRLGAPAAPGGLTETQRRVAEPAAEGLSNPEIAAQVFVARKTVEANLSAVYRKLGVRSRTELARRYPAKMSSSPVSSSVLSPLRTQAQPPPAPE